jgi:hypothetical protein
LGSKSLLKDVHSYRGADPCVDVTGDTGVSSVVTRADLALPEDVGGLANVIE